VLPNSVIYFFMRTFCQFRLPILRGSEVIGPSYGSIWWITYKSKNPLLHADDKLSPRRNRLRHNWIGKIPQGKPQWNSLCPGEMCFGFHRINPPDSRWTSSIPTSSIGERKRQNIAKMPLSFRSVKKYRPKAQRAEGIAHGAEGMGHGEKAIHHLPFLNNQVPRFRISLTQ
jgi:hypothetical protein